MNLSTFFLLLFLASISLFIIGLIKPETSLFWYNKERTKKKSSLIYIGLIIFSFLLFGISTDSKNKAGENENKENENRKFSYNIESEKKSGDFNIINIRINKRITKEQIISLTSSLRTKYPEDELLRFNFWLPGKMVGNENSYASVFYPMDQNVKISMKDKDKNELPIEFIQLGLTEEKANKLKAVKLPNEQYKTILGKFIDEKGLITIIFTDSRETKEQIFISEYFIDSDKPQNTVPLIIKENGIQKMIMNQEGDYYILRDSILTKYSFNENGKPYCSIKDGI